MSTTREVYCYVTNNTGAAINYKKSDITHGEFTHGGYGPLSSISPNADKVKVFYIHKTTGSHHGDTGYVQYSLPDGSMLVFMFNCPYNFAGSGNTGNCWFYAVIQDIPGSVGATNYFVETSVSICNKDGESCAQMAPNPPTNNEQINAYITINPAQ